MRIRGSVVKFTVFSAVALLTCSFLLVAGLRINRNSARHAASVSAAHTASSSATSSADRSKFLDAYGKLPLSFVENQGQTAQEVRYVSHGGQYDLFLTSQEAVLALRRTKRYDLSPRHRSMSIKQMRADRRAATTTAALRMQFEGANPNPQILGAQQLPGKVNYYLGNDPKKWHAGVPTFAQVKYSQVYPGVDLVFYGNQRRLEYDFVVAPGADPNAIRMKLAGARKLRLNSKGDVVVSVTDGDVQLQKPVIYQNIRGIRQEVAGNYSLKGDHISFAIAEYDRSQPLIVDPVLVYATYLGGSGDESAFALVVDASGDAFVGGNTDSTDFPVVGEGIGTNPNSLVYGFVSELNPTGTALLQSTYLGGTTPGGDSVYGLAIDPSGNVYATGQTFATNFPTTANALKPTLSANDSGTSFLAESNSSGTLFYSSYLGGNQGDFANAVAADSSGNAYVTGVTYSSNGTTDITFPVTASARQGTDPEDGSGSAFLTEINTKASGSASLVYSSYLGGDGATSTAAGLGFGDEGFGIALDSNNHAYITGTTTSSNFPFSATNLQSAAPNQVSSAFISEFDTTKLNAASLVYSTYLGGSGNTGAALGDFGTGIDVQSGTTVAYVTGTTNSADFPTTATAYQKTGDATNGSAYVTLLDTGVGSSLKYSTFLGSGGATGYSIKADKTSGKAVVAGATSSPTFPTTTLAYQTSLAAGATGDGFISEIDPSVSGTAGLVYSTYFGGSGTVSNPDQAFALSLGTLPAVYVAGETFSTNFPATAGVVQTALDGPSDAFAAEINLTALPSLSLSATALSFTSTAVGTPAPTQNLTITNNTNTAISFTSATITGVVPAGNTDFTVAPTPAVCLSIPAKGSCIFTVGYTPSVSTQETANLVLVDGDPSSPQTIALTGNITAITPDFTIAASPNTLTVPRGSTGTSTITVASIGAFNSAVTLSCSGAPANSTCTVSPSSVTPAPGVTATATLSFVTTSLGFRRPRILRASRRSPWD